MPQALRSAAIDVAISLCPEIDRELSYEPIRSEHVVALLPAGHALAKEPEIALHALADEEFLVFPRDLAPQLHDVLVGLCRRAGFEPRLRAESFHAGWDTGTLADARVVALVPESVGPALANEIKAVRISTPTDRLETCVVWHERNCPPATGSFRAVARGAFASG